jgi:hypothetical protein
MSIIKKDGSLKGSWVVDTGLKIPEFLLGPLPKGVEERSDLYLEARDGSISADIKIVGAHAERATLQVISRDGSVKVNIVRQIFRLLVKTSLTTCLRSQHDRSEQKFFLRAFSADGSIHLRIPRDFIGLIRHRNGDGSTIFSPAILPHVVTFHSHKKDRLSFIGDFTSSGYGDGADWKGDEIDVESKDGHIKLYFIDEPQVPRQGFFDRLFGK